MKAILKKPGFIAQIVDIEPTAKAIRELLDNEITIVNRHTNDVAVIATWRWELDPDMPINEPIHGYRYNGPAVIVGVDHDNNYIDVPDLDTILAIYVDSARYKRADRRNNNWQCRHCGFLHRFEADGPYENGWKACPACRNWLIPPDGVESEIVTD